MHQLYVSQEHAIKRTLDFVGHNKALFLKINKGKQITFALS